MPRNTESERRAVDDAVKRMSEQQRRNGKLPDTRANEERARGIMEKSAAERREGVRK